MTRLRDVDPQGLSPYLLQHRDNPVDWYEWGEPALEKAAATDRPILLSVGYSTCHWCHVMEKESFQDPATADFMNRHFVAIKVDREERPDIDSIYMDAVHAMTGRGGWPMTVFLTPGGKPFFAGTYYPNVERHGMPSFRRVLEAIRHAWANRREDVKQQAQQLTSLISPVLPAADTLPGQSDLTRAYHTLEQQYDWEHGGFGGAPKFPQAPVLEFLARVAGAPWAPKAQEMLLTTLTKMAQGGIYDHLGGGFARYSVDRIWLVPHFEKMLYDNAELARLYVRAWQISTDPFFRQVAEETLGYLMTDLSHEQGGFFAAEDADSEGVEGKFYVFSHGEFQDTVGGHAELASAYFGVSKPGNFEGSNVLHQASSINQIAERFGITEEHVRRVVAESKKALLARRANRKRPGLDYKIITAWNGLALRALALAGLVLGQSRFLDRARKTARFVLNQMRLPDGRLVRTFCNGPTSVGGFLEDHAAFALGLLELFQATGEVEWFQSAKQIVDLLEPHFGGRQGVIYTGAEDASDLVVRPTNQQDNPSASGASLAAECFLLMGHLTGDFSYHDRFEQIAKAGSRLVQAAPSAAGHLLAVLASYHMGMREVALTGPQALEWAGKLSTRFRPNLVAVPAMEPVDQVPLLADRFSPDQTWAYVCELGVCRQPVNTFEDLTALLTTQSEVST